VCVCQILYMCDRGQVQHKGTTNQMHEQLPQETHIVTHVCGLLNHAQRGDFVSVLWSMYQKGADQAGFLLT
jgi:hypothetical protein